MIPDIGRGGVFNWLSPRDCSTQVLLCVFVYAYGICVYEHRPYCIHIHVSHTIYTIGDIGRKHEIGRCPSTVNRCMRFVYMQ